VIDLYPNVKPKYFNYLRHYSKYHLLSSINVVYSRHQLI